MNRFFYAFLLAFTFSAIPAIAQDDSARTVEEVVVTALRKETNLQDTAITITAITAEDLEVKQIENFEDLQFAVPTLFRELRKRSTEQSNDMYNLKGFAIGDCCMGTQVNCGSYGNGPYYHIEFFRGKSK